MFVEHHGVPPISIVLLVVAFYARQTRRTKPLGSTEAQAPTQYLAADGWASSSKAYPNSRATGKATLRMNITELALLSVCPFNDQAL